MRVIKTENTHGQISIFCEYLFDEHRGSIVELFEKDIRTACRISEENAMGATIKRGSKMITTGSRGRRLKKPKHIGLVFRFSVDPKDADFFNESTFALLR